MTKSLLIFSLLITSLLILVIPVGSQGTLTIYDDEADFWYNSYSDHPVYDGNLVATPLVSDNSTTVYRGSISSGGIFGRVGGGSYNIIGFEWTDFGNPFAFDSYFSFWLYAVNTGGHVVVQVFDDGIGGAWAATDEDWTGWRQVVFNLEDFVTWEGFEAVNWTDITWIDIMFDTNPSDWRHIDLVQTGVTLYGADQVQYQLEVSASALVQVFLVGWILSVIGLVSVGAAGSGNIIKFTVAYFIITVVVLVFASNLPS